MINQSLRTNDCEDNTIDTYADMVYRLAYSYVKSKSDADDIFQEVFLRFYKTKREFECEEHKKAWLLKVTANCCKKHYTSAWVRKTTELTDNLESDLLIFELPESNDLQSVLKKIPQKYSIVIHLFYYEDLSIEQISSILNSKPSTIRTRLTRARALLKKYLKEDYDV